MQRQSVAWILLALLIGGCATGRTSRPDVAGITAPMEPSQALPALESASGPERFAMVSPRLYRGGQPSAQHLELLHALGVTRVIDLRREALGVRRAERATARQLGIELVEYPFYGVFGADGPFIAGLLEELAQDDGGAVYVHCDNGRDRTGLVVALHRVVNEGWSPDRAWRGEVLAHGHRPSLVFREIELTFRDHVRDHEARTQTLRDGPARRRAVAASRDRETGRLASPRSHRAPSITADP